MNLDYKNLWSNSHIGRLHRLIYSGAQKTISLGERDERRRKEIESLADSSSAGVLRSASLVETGDERRRRKRKGRSESSIEKARNNREIFLPAAYKPG